ncbi:MAG: patatin-like phospholipase family protein, partial [Rhodanobacter sp.]
MYAADASALASKRTQQREHEAAPGGSPGAATAAAKTLAPDRPASAARGPLPIDSSLSAAPASREVDALSAKLPPEPAPVLDSNRESEQETVGAQLIGLALSGGGIRSATFSLGVLQRLAMRDTLKQIDMLSTVSGGGYMGAFLSGWIHRSRSPEDVWDQLKRCPENNQTEPEEVQWLRRYSNYLTPRVGALSLDALTVAATYLRNVSLNMSVLIAFVTAIVMVPLLLILPVQTLLAQPATARAGTLTFGLIAFVACFLQLSHACRRRWPRITRPVLVYATVIVPGFLAALFGGAFLASVAASTSWVWACLAIIVGMVLIMAALQLAFSKLVSAA